jgi:sugar lactone lactonase YvrE
VLNKVLIVDTDGLMSVLVSSTQPSYPDAKSARFLAIYSIAVDSQGRVYVADQNDGRFWTVNPDGSLQVLLNAGRYNPLRVATDTAGNVYVAVLTASPAGSGLDIRKMVPGGSFVTLGTIPIAAPFTRGGMAVDGSGNVFVSGNSQVYRVTPAGVVTAIAGAGPAGSSGDGGPATKALLTFPAGVALKSDGTLYVADMDAAVVRYITPDGNIHTVPGTNLALPTDVALDSQGTLYIADGNSGIVYSVLSDGSVHTFAGFIEGSFAGGLPASQTAFFDIAGIGVDGSGNVYVGDNWSVRKISPGTLNQ